MARDRTRGGNCQSHSLNPTDGKSASSFETATVWCRIQYRLQRAKTNSLEMVDLAFAKPHSDENLGNTFVPMSPTFLLEDMRLEQCFGRYSTKTSILTYLLHSTELRAHANLFLKVILQAVLQKFQSPRKDR